MRQSRVNEARGNKITRPRIFRLRHHFISTLSAPRRAFSSVDLDHHLRGRPTGYLGSYFAARITPNQDSRFIYFDPSYVGADNCFFLNAVIAILHTCTLVSRSVQPNSALSLPSELESLFNCIYQQRHLCARALHQLFSKPTGVFIWQAEGRIIEEHHITI